LWDNLKKKGFMVSVVKLGGINGIVRTRMEVKV